MGFKDELKKEMQNVTKDVDLSVSKAWEVTYEGHTIKVENTLMEETLFIDGVEVAKNSRKSIWSHFIPVSKLKADFTLANGEVKRVEVKFSGFVKLQVQIKVDRQVILKEAMKIEMLAPWEEKQAIAPWIIEQIDTHGKIVQQQLPDTEFLLQEDVEGMEPGYRDLIGYEEHTPFYVKNLLKLVQKQLENPTTETRKATYEKILDEHANLYGAELIHSIRESDLNDKAIRSEALWFLEHAAHREVVKFALLLIGCTNEKIDEKYIAKIAMHEEFTRFAIFPLNQSEETLWKLVDQVHGWGKIAIMYELTAFTDEKKLWFLHQTWEDELMRKAIARLRAEKSEVDELLYQEEISEVDFTYISNLIADLVEETDGIFIIDELEYGANLLKHYLNHAGSHLSNEATIHALQLMNTFIHECEEDEWKQHDVETIKQTIENLI